LTAAFVALVVLNGCAVSYVDGDGARRVVGLAEVEVRPASALIQKNASGTPSRAFTGDAITVRGFGLVVNGSHASSNMTFGYVRETTAYLRHCPVETFPACGEDRYSRLAEVVDAGYASRQSLGEDGRDGARFVGFVNLRVPAPPPEAPVGGRMVAVDAWGLVYVATELDATFALDGSRISVAAFAPSALVVDDPLHIAARSDTGTAGAAAPASHELSQRTRR
jgi:hypothetical protein